MQRALFVLILLLAVTAGASADTIYWTDQVNFWPGYGTLSENTKNTIGQPDIIGGYVNIENGFLQSVSFIFTNPPGWSFSLMKPGDLFLDTNSAHPSWDYVLSLYNTSTTYEGAFTGDQTSKYYPKSSTPTLYQITGAETLLVTGSDNQGYWGGYNIRNNQPFAMTGLSVSLGDGSISFDPRGSGTPSSPLTYTLPLNQLLIQGPFTFGFAENCGNDAVYESVKPVPEPGSLVLLASGLLGLAVFAKRRHGAKSK